MTYIRKMMILQRSSSSITSKLKMLKTQGLQKPKYFFLQRKHMGTFVCLMATCQSDIQSISLDKAAKMKIVPHNYFPKKQLIKIIDRTAKMLKVMETFI